MHAHLTPPGLTSRRLAVFAIFAISGISMGTWMSRTPAIRDALDVGVQEFSNLIAGLAIGSIAGLLASGRAIAHLGNRRSIALGLGLASTGLVALALFAGVLGLFAGCLVALVMFGTGAGLSEVAFNVEAAHVERVQRRSMMPWFHASWSLGAVAGSALASAMEGLKVSIAAHIGITGVVLALAVAVAVRFLPSHATAGPEGETVDPGTRGGWEDRASVWREAGVLVLGITVLGMAFAEGSAYDWLALSLVDGHAWSEDAGALAFAVFTAAMLVCRIGGVWLIDQFGRVAVLRASAVAVAVGLAMVLLLSEPWWVFIGVALWGLGAALGIPIGMSAAADHPARPAAAVGAVATVGYLAFLAGPPLIGFLGERVGLLTALWVVFGLILLSALTAGAARRRAASTAATVGSLTPISKDRP